LLQFNDFTYLGYYEVDFNGLDTVWGKAFSHRYVGGQLRFLTMDLRSQLYEIAPPAAFGGRVTVTNQWPNIFTGATWTLGGHVGIWWDEAGQRLWTTDAVDYPDDAVAQETANIATRRLESGGAISGLKRVSLSGVGSRRVYGGCQATPPSWRSQWGLLPYMCGWGGYTSRVAAGLSASLGPTAYGLPDPAGVPNGTTFSTSQFKKYMEYPFQGGDWYASGHPTVGDRGVRNSDVINYYDGGDPRQNPSTPPTVPPVAGAQWLSPAPDSLGRMVWGDSFYNTGMAIDGSQLYGFALVACLSSGKAYYMTSTLNSDRKTFELQIYDPAQFKEVADGARQPWDVKPVSRGLLNLPGMGAGRQGNGPFGCTAGASYDPIAKRVYIYGEWITPEIRNRIYVYDVAGQ
jgi:hypothetical protein